MTYTSAAKESNIQKFRTKEEVVFCKRKFSWNHDLSRTVGILPIQTILEITNWIKKSVDDNYATEQNMINALGELFLHGRATHDKYKNLFMQGAQERRVSFQPPLYEEVCRDFWKNMH